MLFNTVNKAIVVGPVGKDFRLSATTKQEPVFNLSVGTQGPNNRIQWHRFAIFGDDATELAKRVQLGTIVYLEGRFQTRNYTDDNNVKHFSTEIVIESFRVLCDPARAGQAATHVVPAPGKGSTASAE